MSDKINYIGKSAIFSKDGKYRYRLDRAWDAGLPMAMCIGLNPSTANTTEDDTTINNLCLLLKRIGYGKLCMTNLFGFISSDPDDLRSQPNPVGEQDFWLDVTFEECDDVIFCWGSFKQAEYRAKKIIAKYPGSLCFGKTAKGHPIHPLSATIWMRSKCRLQKFNSKLEEVKHG